MGFILRLVQFCRKIASARSIDEPLPFT